MSDLSLTLGEYLAECADKRFDWRTWNCAHFTAGWVRRVAGVDVLAGLPATPSAAAAHKTWRRLGSSPADAVAMRSGLPAVHPAYAQVGDIMLVEAAGRPALGVCAGAGTVVLLSDAGGVVVVPQLQATHAWKVQA